jgi:hypothetical protein
LDISRRQGRGISTIFRRRNFLKFLAGLGNRFGVVTFGSGVIIRSGP